MNKRDRQQLLANELKYIQLPKSYQQGDYMIMFSPSLFPNKYGKVQLYNNRLNVFNSYCVTKFKVYFLGNTQINMYLFLKMKISKLSTFTKFSIYVLSFFIYLNVFFSRESLLFDILRNYIAFQLIEAGDFFRTNEGSEELL